MTRNPNDQNLDNACIARSVADALRTDPALEAVTIDRSQKTIAMATLGQADADSLARKLNESLTRTQRLTSSKHCALLSGNGECTACALPLPESERARITIKHEGQTTTIARVTCPTAPVFWRWRNVPWPKIVPREIEFLEHPGHVDEWKKQLALAAACGCCGLAAWLIAPASMMLPLYLLAYLAGSWFTAQEVWERLQKGAIDVHFLMLAVAVGSASIGAWGEGAMLLFLFSFSSALEHFAIGRTEREISSLFREMPRFATTIDPSGREVEIEVEQLQPGMRILIRPDAQFPVDGELVKGQTAADESNLTGEALPVEKAVGDPVLSGTMNLWGAVEVVVTRPAAGSALSRVIRLIREAQHMKAPAQRFTDTFSGYYTYAVLGLSLAMFFYWWRIRGFAPFASGAGEESAFYHAMTLLVVASPCALVLSIPSAVLAAIAWGARHGILFRGGAAVEKLAGITTVALDKTGTLTTGDLRVQTIESFPPGREQDVARLAYSLEKLSTHPLARAITRYGKQQQLQPLELRNFESIPGHGLRAHHQQEICFLGSRDWICTRAEAALITTIPLTRKGFSEIWVFSGPLLGRIVLRDDLRPEAAGLVQQLQQQRLRTIMLTGDRRAAAESLRTDLGLDDIRAELKPEDKLGVIRSLSAQGQRVAMIGDGVNDAPSLAAAHIGIAMGARGSDAALEQADVVLMHDRLENFIGAFRLSQRARRVIRQNLIVSLGTVVVLVAFALLGKIPLTVGVVGHEGSTVVVVMNSLRLLFGRNLLPGR